MKSVEMWISGIISKNPDGGAYCSSLSYTDKNNETHKKVIKGFTFVKTTENRMKLTAFLKGLKSLKEKCSLRIYTDSPYILNAFEKDHLVNWMKNGWSTKKGDIIKNVDLWEKITGIAHKHVVSIIWINKNAESTYIDDCNQICKSLLRTGKLQYNMIK